MADFYDIDLNFDLDSKGDIKILVDEDAIKQSINTIIKTALGFRAGVGNENVQFGIGINRYLFQQMTQYTGQKLAENIFRQLSVFESRIIVNNVHVDVNLSEQQYDITILYSLKETLQQETFKTVIKQL